MSAAAASAGGARAPWAERSQLERYRDDGPLARALGAALGPLLALPPLLPVLAGAAGVLAVAAIEGDAASDGVVAAAVAWMVLLGGASAGRPHGDRFAWAVPAFLRLSEYGLLIWVGAVVGGSGPAAAFALIAALAFRHYDLVYRHRFQGVGPPAWLELAAGGWDGRLALTAVLLAAGALPAGFFILAGTLGVALTVECVRSWVRHASRPVAIYEDEEDEGD